MATKEQLLSTLPKVIAEDTVEAGIASAIASVQEKREGEIYKAILYPAIDDMDEELLDIIAADFNVKWWIYITGLEAKRRVMKKVWYIWKHIGTPAAVEAAVGALYPGTEISEWFQYDGEPYHFRITIPIPYTEKKARYEDTAFLLEFFKNLRSVMDSATYVMTFADKQYELAVDSLFDHGLTEITLPELVTEYPSELSTGTGMIRYTVIELPEYTPESGELTAYVEGDVLILTGEGASVQGGTLTLTSERLTAENDKLIFEEEDET